MMTAFLGVLFAVSGLTAGWDGTGGGETLPRPESAIWRAPFHLGRTAFRVDRRDGAEGDVVFCTNGIRIVKTNARGAIVVTTAEGFRPSGGSTPQAFAVVSESDGDPMRSLGFVRIWSGRENLTLQGTGAYGPNPQNHFLLGTRPGCVLRKFALPPAESTSGPEFRSAIVVAGAPSTSFWGEWCAECADASAKAWKKYKSALWKKGVRNHSREVYPADVLEKKLASDFEHTAKVVRRNGYSKLLVDGRDAPPVLYKGYGGPFAYCGMRMQDKADVKLQMAGITFGGRVTNDPGIRPHWTRDGFNLTGAVERVRHYMRTAPDSLFILGLGINPYPAFADDYPSERWIGPDGMPVRGKGCIVAWDQKAALKDPKAWTMTSQFSPLWRETVKKHISALVDALKREGLSKRIVGVHASGSHDGQFGMPRYDYSPYSHAAFRTFLKDRYGTVERLSAAWGRSCASFDAVEPPAMDRYGDAESGPDFLVGKENRDLVDFQEFIHHASVGIQEDVARHVKKCFGKDIVAIKYCLSVFAGLRAGEFDFTRFLRSDAIDIFAAQSCYKRRPPSIPIPEKRVTASLHEHGKLYVTELDFEAFHRGPSFCRNEVLAMQWGYLPDFPTWQSANRKAVGQMFAHRQGFWYYDMGGDYFDDDRQLADIRGVMAETCRRFSGTPSDWRPSAAFVIDEKGMMFRNISRGSYGTIVDERDSMAEQLALLEMAGVPFDCYLMSDFLEKPALAERYRTVMLAGSYELDSARRNLIDGLCRSGRTVILGSGAGIVGGIDELGFETVVVPRQKAPGHEVDPAEGYSDAEVKGFFEIEAMRVALGADPGSAKYRVRRPHRVSVRPSEGMEVIGRYADGSAAIASKRIGRGRLVYACDQMGVTPELFNRIVRESGGYACGVPGRIQVSMNGDFISVHCLRTGTYDMKLPFAARVVNLKTGKEETAGGSRLELNLTAGQTCWFSLERRK